MLVCLSVLVAFRQQKFEENNNVDINNNKFTTICCLLFYGIPIFMLLQP